MTTSHSTTAPLIKLDFPEHGRNIIRNAALESSKISFIFQNVKNISLLFFTYGREKVWAGITQEVRRGSHPNQRFLQSWYSPVPRIISRSSHGAIVFRIFGPGVVSDSFSALSSRCSTTNQKPQMCFLFSFYEFCS